MKNRHSLSDKGLRAITDNIVILLQKNKLYKYSASGIRQLMMDSHGMTKIQKPLCANLISRLMRIHIMGHRGIVGSKKTNKSGIFEYFFDEKMELCHGVIDMGVFNERG